MRTGRLSGQVVLIIGGARGIGASVARLFAHEGASVAVGYLSTPEMKVLAQNLAAELREFGGEVVAVEGDLSNPTDPNRLV